MKAAFLTLIGLALVCSAAMAQDATTTKKKKHHKASTEATATSSESASKSSNVASSSGGGGGERSGAVIGEPDIDGCGIGWQVTDKRTIIAATTRGTTNGTVPPTFGMTSGTLGCSKISFAKRDVPAVMYVASNYDALRLEMAEGRGELLDGLARTMGCRDTAAFGRAMQSGYGRIDSDKTTPVRVFERVKEEIRRDPALASNCNA